LLPCSTWRCCRITNRLGCFVGESAQRFSEEESTIVIRLAWVLLGLLGPILCFAPSISAAPDTEAGDVQLTIPLRQGQYYSLLDYCRESNRTLRTTYDLDRVPERLVEFTRQDEQYIKLLSSVTGLTFEIRIDAARNELMLRAPAADSDSERQKRRRVLERLLGIPLDIWPADKGLHLPKGFDPSRQGVLLIHGLESNNASLQPLANEFTRRGVQALTFDYPNDASLAWCGGRLSDELKVLSSQHSRLKLAIVAHSMGGLLARYCLETPGCDPGCVTDLCLLGTPNHGTRLAAGQDLLEFVQEILPAPTQATRSLRDGLGEAALDLHPSSRFLRDLNARTRPKEVRYHLVIGQRGWVSVTERRDIVQDLDRILRGRGVSDVRRAELIGFLKQADELCHGLGDGAVSVRSARLPNVASEQLFDLGHMQLLAGNAPEGQPSAVVDWIMREVFAGTGRRGGPP
jgi:pimeloyl-ACP methyl ester carboxylesterase